MAKKGLLVETVPYRLSDDEKRILKDAEVMAEILKAATERVNATLNTDEERALSLQQVISCAHELAVQRGYKEYTRSFFEAASGVRNRQFAFEQGQQEMWLRMATANTSKSKRSRTQKVNGHLLLSRFEIDVWRGIYRFVLRCHGCYDPALPFKDLRSKYPLTDDELDTTVALTRWITCPSHHNWEPMIPEWILMVIRALISPGST